MYVMIAVMVSNQLRTNVMKGLYKLWIWNRIIDFDEFSRFGNGRNILNISLCLLDHCEDLSYSESGNFELARHSFYFG